MIKITDYIFGIKPEYTDTPDETTQNSINLSEFCIYNTSYKTGKDTKTMHWLDEKDIKLPLATAALKKETRWWYDNQLSLIKGLAGTNSHNRDTKIVNAIKKTLPDDLNED